jgi:DNA-binding NarL/FixJ family response regulator
MPPSSVLTSARERRWDDVNRLLDDGFYRHLLTAPRDLRDAFDLLPDEWFDRHPRHRMTRSLAAAAGPRQLVDDDSFDAFVRWVESQDSPDTRDLLGVETAHLRRMVAVRNFDGARTQADRIRAMITGATDTRGFHDVLPSVLLRVGQSYLQVGDLDAAADSFVGARRFAAGAGAEHPFDPYVRAHLALVDALHDRFADARSRLAPPDVLDAHRDSSLAGQLGLTDLAVRALVEVCSGSRQDADAALARLADDDALSDLWWVGSLARARAAAQWGAPRDGIATLRRELRDHGSAARPELLAGQLLAAELATLYQLDGDLRAEESVLAAVDVDGAAFVVRVARARGLLMRGDARGAAQMLQGGCPADLGSASATALRLALESVETRVVSPESLDRATDAMRSDASAYTIQQVTTPLREQLLRASFPGRDRFRASFRYPRRVSRVDLSDREREVLSALRLYSRSLDIAAHLHVSVNTIKTHRRNLYAKLGVNGRREALDAADRIEGERPPRRG